MIKEALRICLLCLFPIILWGQGKGEFDFDGQLSILGNYAPLNEHDLFLGIRYLPELSYKRQLDSIKLLDFNASANIYGNLRTPAFDTVSWDGRIQPYRAWVRYGDKQYEVRLGLQKIDFGSATILRPIQWFNQIDPRDPLRLTNGVYGLLGRYYFLDNTNIWLWVLYGNKNPRGFDALGSNWKLPEVGTRLQLPIKQGEIAFSYHYRTATTEQIPLLPLQEKIPENRLGIDAKWDFKIGFWLEMAVVNKSKDVGILTNQSLFNLGMDYTFGIGNGLGLTLEHLSAGSGRKFLGFDSHAQMTAGSLSYPITLFDNLNAVVLYNWISNDFIASLNYQHQFKKITAYLIAYYNPDVAAGIVPNDLSQQFSGPGFRVLLVYQH